VKFRDGPAAVIERLHVSFVPLSFDRLTTQGPELVEGREGETRLPARESEDLPTRQFAVSAARDGACGNVFDLFQFARAFAHKLPGMCCGGATEWLVGP